MTPSTPSLDTSKWINLEQAKNLKERGFEYINVPIDQFITLLTEPKKVRGWAIFSYPRWDIDGYSYELCTCGCGMWMKVHQSIDALNNSLLKNRYSLERYELEQFVKERSR